MGDRTYCQVTIAEAHQEALQDIFDDDGWFIQDDAASSGRFVYEDSEANYGGHDVQKALEEKKLPFYGYHDAGGDYGPEVFAFDGEKFAECPGLEGAPVCTVDSGGEPNRTSLADAVEYWRIYHNAERLMTEANTAALAEK